jgi:hypothetical protein
VRGQERPFDRDLRRRQKCTGDRRDDQSAEGNQECKHGRQAYLVVFLIVIDGSATAGHVDRLPRGSRLGLRRRISEAVRRSTPRFAAKVGSVVFMVVFQFMRAWPPGMVSCCGVH